MRGEVGIAEGLVQDGGDAVTGWPRVALGDVFTIARGGSPRPIDAFITDAPDGVNWIMIGDATEGSKYISSTRKRIRREGVSRSREVKPGDFLLTNSMSFGRPYILDTPGCIHDGWLVLSPRGTEVNQDYFYHLLGSPLVYAEFERLAAGAVVKNLNSELVRRVKVPVPPLAEQHRIADILDKADAIRRKRKEAIALTEELLRSAFLEMFGDPVTNPKGWAVVSLGETFADDPRIGTLVPAGNEPGILVVRVGELGRYDVALERCKRAVLSAAEHTRYLLEAGDVLLARAIGSEEHLGKASVLQQTTEPVAFDSHVMRLRFRSDAMDPYFFVQWLCSAGGRKRFMREAGRTAVQFNVNGKQIARVRIPRPPFEDQRRFRAVFDRVRTCESKASAALVDSDSVFRSLVQQAFSGQLEIAETSC